MGKIIVRAVKRDGYDGVWRAGRKWSSDQEHVVEVLDADECPMVPVDVQPGQPKRNMLDPERIGRKAYAAVMADEKLSKRPLGDLLSLTATADELAAANAECAVLREKVIGLEAVIGLRDDQIAELEDQLEAATVPKQLRLAEENVKSDTGKAFPKK